MAIICSVLLKLGKIIYVNLIITRQMMAILYIYTYMYHSPLTKLLRPSNLTFQQYLRKTYWTNTGRLVSYLPKLLSCVVIISKTVVQNPGQYLLNIKHWIIASLSYLHQVAGNILIYYISLHCYLTLILHTHF